MKTPKRWTRRFFTETQPYEYQFNNVVLIHNSNEKFTLFLVNGHINLNSVLKVILSRCTIFNSKNSAQFWSAP